uniref:alpha-N-acetylgalactosaminide alpha-2,6-sialyltransferase n=1 Tax=Neogobius melanostomus TaxID=47308 RepID=A0A8C6T475_9GOBI
RYERVITRTILTGHYSHDTNGPGGDRCLRCAVVGNGGILRGSKQGRAIDEHDYVFRVNGAVLRRFEEDVGTKTSFYGFTTNTMKNGLLMYRGDGFYSVPQSHSLKYIFIPSNLRDYVMLSSATQGRYVPSGPDRGDRPWRYFGEAPPSRFRMLHPEFIHYVTHSFLKSPLMLNPKTRHLFMPSTGALLLLTALHTCHQVSAFGFITENFASFSDHYYDSVHKPLRFFSNHDLHLEQRLWETLHQRGVISLLHRDV